MGAGTGLSAGRRASPTPAPGPSPQPPRWGLFHPRGMVKLSSSWDWGGREEGQACHQGKDPRDSVLSALFTPARALLVLAGRGAEGVAGV